MLKTSEKDSALGQTPWPQPPGLRWLPVKLPISLARQPRTFSFPPRAQRGVFSLVPEESGIFGSSLYRRLSLFRTKIHVRSCALLSTVTIFRTDPQESRVKIHNAPLKTSYTQVEDACSILILQGPNENLSALWPQFTKLIVGLFCYLKLSFRFLNLCLHLSLQICTDIFYHADHRDGIYRNLLFTPLFTKCYKLISKILRDDIQTTTNTFQNYILFVYVFFPLNLYHLMFFLTFNLT